MLPTAAGEISAWAALGVAAWSHSALAFRWSETLIDGLLAAVLVVLLGLRVTRLLPRLRRRLGRRLGEPPATAFFVLPFMVYLALLPWTTSHRAPDGDEPYYLLITHSLAFDFDTDLTDDYADDEAQRFVDRTLEPQFGDPIGSRGELYSRHGTTLPLLLAPAYRAAGKHGALAMMAALAAGLAWAFVRAARHDYADKPRAVLVAWAVLAFSPPLVLYAHQIWIEVPAALLVVLAWDAARVIEGDPRPSPKRWLALLLPLVALPLLKLRFAAIALPLLALVAARLGVRARRVLFLAGIGFAAFLALVLAVNWLRFGNPLKYIHIRPATFLTAPTVYLNNLLGLGFDGAFGLVPSAPIWATAIAGVVFWVQRRARLLADAAVLFGIYLIVVVGSNAEWYGAWSPPFRYAMVTLPFVGLALTEALAAPRTRGARMTWATLVTATAALGVLWIVLPGWTYNLADGTSHLTDALSASFQADLGRFVPSMVRPRLATWCVSVMALALVPVAWRTQFGLGRRRGSSRWETDLGVALALLTVPAWLLAARQLPTHVIEFEDAQVRAEGGALDPPRWTPGRYRFRGGWNLDAGSSIRAPVVSGGGRLAIRLAWRPQCDGAVIELGTERKVLERKSVPDSNDAWSTIDFGPVEWPKFPDGRSLVLTVAGNARTAACSILLDRAVLAWDPTSDPPGT